MAVQQRISGALLLVPALCGCAHRRPSEAPPTTVEDRGSVGYAFLMDPAVARPAGYHFVPPAPREQLSLPEYPPAALEGRAGAAHVLLRIVIDTRGRVAEVRDSPLGASSSGRFATEFRDAVLRSLRHWCFLPGRLEQLADGPDDDADGQPDYRTTTSMEEVRVFYDVRFDFDVVSGAGRVRTSASTSKGEEAP